MTLKDVTIVVTTGSPEESMSLLDTLVNHWGISYGFYSRGALWSKAVDRVAECWGTQNKRFSLESHPEVAFIIWRPGCSWKNTFDIERDRVSLAGSYKRISYGEFVEAYAPNTD